MNNLLRFKLFIWTFGKFKVPMIGYLKPKLIKIDDDEIIIKIKLKRRSKNHLNSMYFGALAVGADLAGGLYSFYYGRKNNVKGSVAFKSFDAKFLKRPESDVYFVCTSGKQIEAMVNESVKTKQRINQKIPVNAYINFPEQKEEVAKFMLELSIKVFNQ